MYYVYVDSRASNSTWTTVDRRINIGGRMDRDDAQIY